MEFGLQAVVVAERGRRRCPMVPRCVRREAALEVGVVCLDKVFLRVPVYLVGGVFRVPRHHRVGVQPHLLDFIWRLVQ